MEICFGPTDAFVPCPDILRRLKLDGDLRAFERFETRGGGLDDLHGRVGARRSVQSQDRKSTRLNSSHLVISYAVFCLKKKTQHKTKLIGTSLRERLPHTIGLAGLCA